MSESLCKAILFSALSTSFYPCLAIFLGLGPYISPFFYIIHKILSCLYLFWNLIFPDCLFFIKIICLISSWLISILRVSSDITHFFLPIMLPLELSQLLLCYLTVSTHFKKTLTFSVLPSGYQMSHLLFDHRRRACVFCKLHFFLVWSRPPVFQ